MRKTQVLDRRVYHPGQVLFREGESAWAAFMIEEGTVEILRHEGTENEIVLATVGEGELIGEMGLIDGSPRSATARARATTVTQVIAEQNFARLLAQAEPGLVALLQVLLRRLRATNAALSGCHGEQGGKGDTPGSDAPRPPAFSDNDSERPRVLN